jgi:hypothetical protein
LDAERLDNQKMVRAGDAPQHMQALARANRLRLARAELKRAIARGDIEAADVVRECPWETESMTLAELLTSQRRWGRTRTRKFLVALALNENKRLGTLTEKQRAALAASLGREFPPTRPSPDVVRTEPGHDEEDDWAELRTVIERQDKLSAEVRHLATRRDELICRLSDAGASRRAVAEVASLTVGRVQQILDEARARPVESASSSQSMD